MFALNMTYSGLTYRTTTIGTYQTTRPEALTPIGTHGMSLVNRQPETTLIDPWMLEAFQAYPPGYSFTDLEGWSRSYYSSSAHVAAIKRFSKVGGSTPPVDLSWSATIEYCQQYFSRLPKTISLDFHTDFDKVPFENTSSAGVGFSGAKKGDPGVYSLALKRAVATIHECLRGNLQHVIEQSTPDAAFTRTQLTQLSEKLKVRNIFGQAFQYILIEGLSAFPIMNLFSEIDSVFFCGKDPRVHVPRLLLDFSLRNERILNIDWTAFDSSAEPWEINMAFDLLESVLDFPNLESRACFEFSRIFFINRKINSPDGITYFKQRGVPSGSFYTMIVDSIINWIRILYLHHKAYGEFPKDISTQGDDGIIGTKGNVTPEGLFLQTPANTTWSLDPSKCRYGDSPSTVSFLQRFVRHCDQARDVKKVERLAIYPEYSIESGVISAYRARALWEDCNYESDILSWATKYLEEKFGRTDPNLIPRRYKSYHQIFFNSK